MGLKFIILGCGSSMGIPRVDGYFGKCDPREKKNYRTRCSAIIKSKFGNTLIDTSPDLRFQFLKNSITDISRVLYSHSHGDQTHGINDLRIFYLKNKKKIPVFANKSTIVDFPAPGGAVNTALFVFFSCSASSSRTENMGKF